MQEQGIAWMIAGGTHAESPEERRQRSQLGELRRSRPRSPWRDRLAAAISGHAITTPTSSATDCCPA